MLNEYTDRQKALVKYFKLVPEFDALSIFDKIRLIKNHFCVTLTINEAVLATDISQNLLDSIAMMFDNTLATSLGQCIQLVHNYTSDRLLLKLLLIVRSFSSDINRCRNDIDMDRIYDDTLAIFKAQNIYTELLWRYLLSRLPSEVHVVKFYDKLIRDLIYVQRVCFMTESHINQLTGEIQQMEPLIQSMWPTESHPTNIQVKAVGWWNFISSNRTKIPSRHVKNQCRYLTIQIRHFCLFSRIKRTKWCQFVVNYLVTDDERVDFYSIDKQVLFFGVVIFTLWKQYWSTWKLLSSIFSCCFVYVNRSFWFLSLNVSMKYHWCST